ncbi:hypothetical protein M9H77_15505 [Catharanthus roseus]|uniref:Uncharacterized protein n=1 Tax=Catharanthus roseus TaxID=4058 RepID=A0ACC0AXB7_CATRO|nr:hypothetical protein M9H77_15505 [Catharanthus roseus]
MNRTVTQKMNTTDSETKQMQKTQEQFSRKTVTAFRSNIYTSRLGRQQQEPNELCEFGLSMCDEGQPRSVLPVKNSVNPSVNLWPQETALSLSLSKGPFPLTRNHTHGNPKGRLRRKESINSQVTWADRVEPGPLSIKGLPAQLPLLKRPTWCTHHRD